MPIRRSTIATLGRAAAAARTPQPVCQSRYVSSMLIRPAYAVTASRTVAAVVNSTQVWA